MPKTSLIMASLMLVLLLGACQKNEMDPRQTEEQRWLEARAICLEQAQDMTNSTVSVANPNTNDYFRSCMRARFNYTDEELRVRGY